MVNPSTKITFLNVNLPPKIEERLSTILTDDDAFFMLEDAPVDFLETSA